MKGKIKEWFDDACWHAPTLLVLDNLDRMLGAEVEVSSLPTRPIFGSLMLPTARGLVPSASSHQHLHLDRAACNVFPTRDTSRHSAVLDLFTSSAFDNSSDRRDCLSARA